MVAHFAENYPYCASNHYHPEAFYLRLLPPRERLGDLNDNLSILLTIYDTIPMERRDAHRHL